MVTSHDQTGKTFFKHDDEVERLDLTPEHATFAVMWTTNTTPVDNMSPQDGALKPVFSGGLHNVGGSVLRIVDFPPNTQSPMHCTQSLDYGLVIWGEIEVELDSGEKRLLGPSEVCIQRGTNHLWRNKSDKWTRMAYVLLDAQELIFDGKKLEDVQV